MPRSKPSALTGTADLADRAEDVDVRLAQAVARGRRVDRKSAPMPRLTSRSCTNPRTSSRFSASLSSRGSTGQSRARPGC